MNEVEEDGGWRERYKKEKKKRHGGVDRSKRKKNRGDDFLRFRAPLVFRSVLTA